MIRLLAIILFCASSAWAQLPWQVGEQNSVLSSSSVAVATSETAAYFENTGATYPWYGEATTPSVVYDSSTTTTWFAWEGWDGSTRNVSVTTYNHTSAQWSDVYVASNQLMLVDDDHGVPSLIRDANGYWTVFYGSHGNHQYYATTAFPDDPSTWRNPGTIQYVDTTIPALTYPHPVLVGSSIYLFGRTPGVSTFSALILFVATPASNGVIPTPWSAGTVIADYGEDSRFYLGNCVLRGGTKIHMASTHAKGDDSYRRDVHYLVYNTANGQVETIAGVSNAVPLDLTTLDSTYKIVSQPTPTGSGDHPALAFDAANVPHVLYMDGALASTAFDVWHIAYVSGAWTTPYKLGTAYSKDSEYVIVPNASTSGVDAYWTQQSGTPAWYVGSGRRDGGDIWKASRTSGGTWGSSNVFHRATTWAMNEPSMVLNGHADARVVFTEITQDSTAESGALRGFAYGDTGSLARTSNRYVPAVKWDTRYLSSGSVLTNNFLTATSSSTRLWNRARGATIIGAAEKKYWEITIGTVTTAGDFAVGAQSHDATLNDSNYLGSEATGVAYFADGSVYQNGSSLGAIATYTSGDNVGVAYDRSANKIWFRKNGGNWNNAVIGSQNPATGTGGKSINAITNACAALNLRTTGENVTAKFAAADWVYTAPSGFSALTN